MYCAQLCKNLNMIVQSLAQSLIWSPGTLGVGSCFSAIVTASCVVSNRKSRVPAGRVPGLGQITW